MASAGPEAACLGSRPCSSQRAGESLDTFFRLPGSPLPHLSNRENNDSYHMGRQEDELSSSAGSLNSVPALKGQHVHHVHQAGLRRAGVEVGER